MRYGVSDTVSPSLAPVAAKPSSLTSMVFDNIRDAIVAKQLPPGMRLSEARLAAQLDVSKTPVRESLLRLEHIGLVVSDRGRGLSVVTPSRQTIENAYEVRAGLESLAARLAAERADDATRSRVTEAAAGSLSCAELSDDGGRRAWDRTFHGLVTNAAANPRLANLIEDQYLLTWALRQRDVDGSPDGVECARQHVLVAAAIDDHDGEAAASAMLDHLTQLRRVIVSALPADNEAEASA